jgi:hypothetical protein
MHAQSVGQGVSLYIQNLAAKSKGTENSLNDPQGLYLYLYRPNYFLP